jgi:nucleoside-diphosphate-sugar epimerase
MNPTILTGATGFLGGHLLAALLERGEQVLVLGRAAGGRSLAARIASLLDWFGLGHHEVETLEVDLAEPRCGLAGDRYRALCARAGPFIHCASDTRFSERRRPEIVATNVYGLGHVLDLFADSRAPFFHYVSTAYVAGRTNAHCPEALVDGEHEFANVYEETKAHAERVVAARCRRAGLPYTILRPSVVYGHSRTGRSTRFNALYHPVKSLAYLKEIYLNDLSIGGLSARALGIKQLESGVMRLPLRVFVAHRGRLNLIPIDYFVSAVLRILETAEDGAIYHLTSDAPTTLDEVARYCQDFLRLEGIEIIEGEPNGTPLSPPEELFRKFVGPYLPYLADTRSFDRRHTDQATGGLRPPPLSYEIFERCMQYAMSVDWGFGEAQAPAAAPCSTGVPVQISGQARLPQANHQQ